MQPNIYNFFKFLEGKENRSIPLRVKFTYAPETLTPQELNIEGSLYLSNNEKLEKLPKGLTVKGNLWLANTPITSLPEGLTVENSLILSNTKITSLPKGLKVKRNLWVENTPLSTKTDEKIREMIGPDGYINGKIIR